MTVPRAYLDTNVLIAAHETGSAWADHAWWLLAAIDMGEVAGVTSELTLAELLVKPFRQNDTELAETYQAIITDNGAFTVAAVSRDILIEAARLRAMRSTIRLPDAIHIATAKNAECGFLVSADKRLPQVEGLKCVPLGPLTLDHLRTGRP